MKTTFILTIVLTVILSTQAAAADGYLITVQKAATGKTEVYRVSPEAADSVLNVWMPQIDPNYTVCPFTVAAMQSNYMIFDNGVLLVYIEKKAIKQKANGKLVYKTIRRNR